MLSWEEGVVWSYVVSISCTLHFKHYQGITLWYQELKIASAV